MLCCYLFLLLLTFGIGKMLMSLEGILFMLFAHVRIDNVFVFGENLTFDNYCLEASLVFQCSSVNKSGRGET